MKKQVIITRPYDDAIIFGQLCIQQDISPIYAPMMEITSYDDDNIHIQDQYTDALIFTSANGVRMYEKHSTKKDILTFCVGQRTAAQARIYGYQHIIASGGDVDILADDIIAYYKKSPNKKKPVIRHIAAVDIAGDLQILLQDHVYYHKIICYHANAVSHISSELRTALCNTNTYSYLCFFSKRTARIFFDLIKNDNDYIKVQQQNIVCLSKNIAQYCQEFLHKNIITASSHDSHDVIDLIKNHK